MTGDVVAGTAEVVVVVVVAAIAEVVVGTSDVSGEEVEVVVDVAADEVAADVVVAVSIPTAAVSAAETAMVSDTAEGAVAAVASVAVGTGVLPSSPLSLDEQADANNIRTADAARAA